MIRIRTGSRLHFGLLSLPTETQTACLNQEGEATIPRRQFGGVGLMVDQPGIELTVEPATTWSAKGPLAERALRFAHAYCDSVGMKNSFHLSIESAAPEHAGLGTGTQLGLAVARAISGLTHQPCAALTLAGQVGRGLRSALGIHGFERGGFLIEGGKTSDAAISPLLYRCDFPGSWQILLITPRDVVGTHGPRESDAFADLAKHAPADRATESLCRIVLLGMLPALAQNDLPTFGETVYDFNRRVGAMFQVVQGGLYAHPRLDEIVKTIRAFGIKGVGQSSWGPTIFALVTAEETRALWNWLMQQNGIGAEEMTIAGAFNRGAALSTEYPAKGNPENRCAHPGA